MSYSFYGGQQGRNFEIAKVFHNKVELMQDLMKRWYSSIGVGELVIVSYGNPNDTISSFYQKNAETDINAWDKTYNVTLWQKIYNELDNAKDQERLLASLAERYKNEDPKPKTYWDEYFSIIGVETQYVITALDELEKNFQEGKISKAEYDEQYAKIINENREFNSEDFGLGYKLIASLAGSTPNIQIEYEVISANKKPYIKIDSANADHPILTFYLPTANIELDDTIILDVDEIPNVSLDTTKKDASRLKFSLPQSQVILPENVNITTIDADKDPNVVFDTIGQNTDNTKKINRPTVEFQMPQAQKIVKEHIGNTVLDADKEPEVVVDTTGTNSDGTKKINEPSIEFKLPQSQIITKDHVTTTYLGLGESAQVVFDDTGVNSNDTPVTQKINRPTLEFKLPKNQVISKDEDESLEADQSPEVEFTSEDDEDNDGIVQSLLKFKLPKSQVIKVVQIEHLKAKGDEDKVRAELITSDSDDPTVTVTNPILKLYLPTNQTIKIKDPAEVLDADKDPIVKIDDTTNPDEPTLIFSLPQSQILKLNPTIVLPPSQEPSSQYDDDTDINNPELTFSLPRAVKFMYGERLGKRIEDNGIYTLQVADAPEIEELRIGDYYVNEGTGFIYLITDETITPATDTDPEVHVDRTFTYQACLAAPVPTITSATVDPYKNNNGVFEIKDPTIKKSFSNDSEKTGLVLGFELPRLPILKSTVEFCGPDEEGAVQSKPTSTSEYTYMFTIPTGARFYCINEDNEADFFTTIVADARPGDFYINGIFGSNDDGNLYKLDTDGNWILKGNIKGNDGNPLNITKSFTITPTEVSVDNLDTVSAYLEAELGKKPDGHEIIAVTYREDSALGGTIDTAYWYYVANKTWGRAQLTGATASLIQNDYKAAGDTNKVYSVSYINNLLAALDTVLTADEKKIKTYSVETIEELVSWGSFEDLE